MREFPEDLVLNASERIRRLAIDSYRASTHYSAGRHNVDVADARPENNEDLPRSA